MLRRDYERRQFDVKAASSGTEALALVMDWQPEIAIVDLVLDGYDAGLLVVAQLRALFPHSRIVLISGAATGAIGSKARDCGADTVVDKPASVLDYLGESDEERTEFPTLEEVERAHVHRALLLTGGNHTRAAKLLDIGRASLLRKLDKWGLR